MTNKQLVSKIQFNKVFRQSLYEKYVELAEKIYGLSENHEYVSREQELGYTKALKDIVSIIKKISQEIK